MKFRLKTTNYQLETRHLHRENFHQVIHKFPDLYELWAKCTNSSFNLNIQFHFKLGNDLLKVKISHFAFLTLIY